MITTIYFPSSFVYILIRFRLQGYFCCFRKHRRKRYNFTTTAFHSLIKIQSHVFPTKTKHSHWKSAERESQKREKKMFFLRTRSDVFCHSFSFPVLSRKFLKTVVCRTNSTITFTRFVKICKSQRKASRIKKFEYKRSENLALREKCYEVRNFVFCFPNKEMFLSFKRALT